MRVNQLCKGARVTLRNGWEAEMVTVRGNTPTAKVFGDYTEVGSVYAHDIVSAVVNGAVVAIEHTPEQIKLRRTVAAMGL